MKYFLAVAREENISRAADILYVTQPTLSRQLMDLQDQPGTQLFIRSNREITLTDEGMLLRKRAEDVTERLNKGPIDFGILIGPADKTKYESLRLPSEETWGVLMRRDRPLASRSTISPGDLRDMPLIARVRLSQTDESRDRSNRIMKN